MRDTVILMPFIVRLQDGREWRGYARGVTTAEVSAQIALDGAVVLGRNGAANPAVLVIRADEPFVRPKPRRHWLLRLLIGNK